MRVQARGAEPRQSMQLRDQPQLLNHVIIVVQTGAINADPDVYSLLSHEGDRRDTATQSQVRAGIVTHSDPSVGHQLEVRPGRPDRVGKRGARTEEVEVVQPSDVALAVLFKEVMGLVRTLHDVNMEDR